jgi:8-oxo-dGTP pyrophosphatase MutT (NUDIX family)
MNIRNESRKPQVSIAGAVVYRMNDTTIEFLVQKSRKNPAVWLFPKGHVEKGETDEEAALRELKEESGVSGQNVGFLHEFVVEFEDEIQKVTFFLFKFSGIDGEPEKGRDPEWLDASSAIACLTYQEYSKMIKIAVERLANQVTSE